RASDSDAEAAYAHLLVRLRKYRSLSIYLPFTSSAFSGVAAGFVIYLMRHGMHGPFRFAPVLLSVCAAVTAILALRLTPWARVAGTIKNAHDVRAIGPLFEALFAPRASFSEISQSLVRLLPKARVANGVSVSPLTLSRAISVMRRLKAPTEI